MFGTYELVLSDEYCLFEFAGVLSSILDLQLLLLLRIVMILSGRAVSATVHPPCNVKGAQTYAQCSRYFNNKYQTLCEGLF